MMRIMGILATVVIIAVVAIMMQPFSVEKSVAPGSEPLVQRQQTAQSRKHFASCPVADGFVFPVGPPDAHRYYNAQPFGRNNHLGEDWNGKGGGNTDLGDPIYSVANGIVFYAREAGPGWGNVVRIYHNIGTSDDPEYVESLYGHLKALEIANGDVVVKNQRIGTMGNVDGQYYAHLHLEIRTTIGMPVGGGYSQDKNGFVEPTAFIRLHREVKKSTNKELKATVDTAP